VQVRHFVAVGMTSDVQGLAAENFDCLRTVLVNAGCSLSAVIVPNFVETFVKLFHMCVFIVIHYG